MLIAKTENQASHFKAALEHEGHEPVIVIDQGIWAVCLNIAEARLFMILSAPRQQKF